MPLSDRDIKAMRRLASAVIEEGATPKAVALAELVNVVARRAFGGSGQLQQRLARFHLTPREMDVACFVSSFVRTNGMSPSMVEIGEALGISKVTAFELVERLRSKGVIRRNAPRKTRSLALTVK